MSDKTTIKLFQLVQKFYHIQGIDPPASNRSGSYIGKNLFIQFCLVQMFISATLFFLFKAQSMFEFGITFYASATELYVFSYFTVTLWKMANIFELIWKFENFIGKSKYSLKQFDWSCMIHFHILIKLKNRIGMSNFFNSN